MALDTAAKRASSLGFQLPFVKPVIPDGALDQGDRQTIANAYAGILAEGAAALPDAPRERTIYWQAQSRTIVWEPQDRTIEWNAQNRTIAWEKQDRTIKVE